MYGSQSTYAWLPYICLLFSGFSNVYYSACVWPTALKLGCATNFDMLFLVMGFISVNQQPLYLHKVDKVCVMREKIPIWFVLPPKYAVTAPSILKQRAAAFFGKWRTSERHTCTSRAGASARALAWCNTVKRENKTHVSARKSGRGGPQFVVLVLTFGHYNTVLVLLSHSETQISRLYWKRKGSSQRKWKSCCN